MLKTLAKIGFVFIFISVALWFFVFSPLLGDISTTRRSVKQTRQVYEQKKRKAERLKKLKEEYKSLGSEVTKVNTMLPEKPRFPQLLLEMNNLVVQSGVSSANLDFARVGKDKGSGLQEYQIGVNFEANYFNFKQFLEKKREEMRLMDIDSISLNPQGEGGDYEFSVELVTYYYNG